MSERLTSRPYTPTDRLLAERFLSSPEKRAEYEAQGLIATNNLGWRMLVFEAGPESTSWQFYASTLFTPQIVEYLAQARASEPNLWQESVAAYRTQTDASQAYFTALETYGADDPRTKDFEHYATELQQRDIALRSQIFAVIEQQPLSEEEAIALCI